MKMNKSLKFELFGIKINISLLAFLMPLVCAVPYLSVSGLTPAIACYSVFLIILLCHEMGHAFVGKAMGGNVEGVFLTWYGGYCKVLGRFSHKETAILASGGVAAQGILLFVGLVLMLLFSFGPSTFMGVFLLGLTKWNLLIIGSNLIPFGPLDGGVIFDYIKNRKKYNRLDQAR